MLWYASLNLHLDLGLGPSFGRLVLVVESERDCSRRVASPS